MYILYYILYTILYNIQYIHYTILYTILHYIYYMTCIHACIHKSNVHPQAESQLISHRKSCLTIPKSNKTRFQIYATITATPFHNALLSTISTISDGFYHFWWILMDTDIIRRSKIPSYDRTWSTVAKFHHMHLTTYPK